MINVVCSGGWSMALECLARHYPEWRWERGVGEGDRERRREGTEGGREGENVWSCKGAREIWKRSTIRMLAPQGSCQSLLMNYTSKNVTSRISCKHYPNKKIGRCWADLTGMKMTSSSNLSRQAIQMEFSIIHYWPLKFRLAEFEIGLPMRKGFFLGWAKTPYSLVVWLSGWVPNQFPRPSTGLSLQRSLEEITKVWVQDLGRRLGSIKRLQYKHDSQSSHKNASGL